MSVEEHSNGHGGPGYASPQVAREQPPEKLIYTTTFADEQANPIEGMPGT